MSIKIIVNGALGRMGQQVCQMIEQDKEFTLVGKANRSSNLGEMIDTSGAQIVIDFTHPAVGYQNTKKIIQHNAHPIIGTTGFTPEQITELKKMSAEKKIGGIIAPNFSIGAVLMMKYASDAAKYFPHVEIIEMHHDAKADAPSGTALKTAEMINKNKIQTSPKVVEKNNLAGVRGGVVKDIHIHSVRLPGFVADQEVVFGGQGETFRIIHRTIDREAFMPGVKLACQKVLQLQQLVYGLEEIL